MSDLDKKLEEKVMEAARSTIWINKIDDMVRKKVHPDWFTANGQTFTFGVDIDVDLIKQAFIDDGWVRIPEQARGKNYMLTERELTWTDDTKVHRMEGDKLSELMTGQEWYGRFEKELLESKQGDKLWLELYYTGKREFSNQQYRDTKQVVLGAAKKASGIE